MGSSTYFPLNIGIYEGRICSISDQLASWAIGSITNLEISGRFKLDLNSKLGLATSMLLLMLFLGGEDLGIFGGDLGILGEGED